MRNHRVALVVLGVAWLQLFTAHALAAADEPALLTARPIPFELAPLVAAPQVIVLTSQQVEDAEQWARDFAEWQKWAEHWLNRRQPGFWAYAVERNKKPDPPVWLEQVCGILPDDDPLMPACRLLAQWRDDAISARNHQAATTAFRRQEDAAKSVWWRHVHVDGLWSTTQSNVAALGLFGAHITMEVEGRLQVFVAPGILLVSVPSLYGDRQLSAATDWGVSYRLFNAGRSTVHFNLVHAWVLGSTAGLVNANMTLAGFSFTFRPQPH